MQSTKAPMQQAIQGVLELGGVVGDEKKLADIAEFYSQWYKVYGLIFKVEDVVPDIAHPEISAKRITVESILVKKGVIVEKTMVPPELNEFFEGASIINNSKIFLSCTVVGDLISRMRARLEILNGLLMLEGKNKLTDLKLAEQEIKRFTVKNDTIIVNVGRKLDEHVPSNVLSELREQLAEAAGELCQKSLLSTCWRMGLSERLAEMNEMGELARKLADRVTDRFLENEQLVATINDALNLKDSEEKVKDLSKAEETIKRCLQIAVEKLDEILIQLKSYQESGQLYCNANLSGNEQQVADLREGLKKLLPVCERMKLTSCVASINSLRAESEKISQSIEEENHRQDTLLLYTVNRLLGVQRPDKIKDLVEVKGKINAFLGEKNTEVKLILTKMGDGGAYKSDEELLWLQQQITAINETIEELLPVCDRMNLERGKKEIASLQEQTKKVPEKIDTAFKNNKVLLNALNAALGFQENDVNRVQDLSLAEIKIDEFIHNTSLELSKMADKLKNSYNSNAALTIADERIQKIAEMLQKLSCVGAQIGLSNDRLPNFQKQIETISQAIVKSSAENVDLLKRATEALERQVGEQLEGLTSLQPLVEEFLSVIEKGLKEGQFTDIDVCKSNMERLGALSAICVRVNLNGGLAGKITRAYTSIRTIHSDLIENQKKISAELTSCDGTLSDIRDSIQNGNRLTLQSLHDQAVKVENVQTKIKTLELAELCKKLGKPENFSLETLRQSARNIKYFIQAKQKDVLVAEKSRLNDIEQQIRNNSDARSSSKGSEITSVELEKGRDAWMEFGSSMEDVDGIIGITAQYNKLIAEVQLRERCSCLIQSPVNTSKSDISIRFKGVSSPDVDTKNKKVTESKSTNGQDKRKQDAVKTALKALRDSLKKGKNSPREVLLVSLIESNVKSSPISHQTIGLIDDYSRKVSQHSVFVRDVVGGQMYGLYSSEFQLQESTQPNGLSTLPSSSSTSTSSGRNQAPKDPRLVRSQSVKNFGAYGRNDGSDLVKSMSFADGRAKNGGVSRDSNGAQKVISPEASPRTILSHSIAVPVLRAAKNLQEAIRNLYSQSPSASVLTQSSNRTISRSLSTVLTSSMDNNFAATPRTTVSSLPPALSVSSASVFNTPPSSPVSISRPSISLVNSTVLESYRSNAQLTEAFPPNTLYLGENDTAEPSTTADLSTTTVLNIGSRTSSSVVSNNSSSVSGAPTTSTIMINLADSTSVFDAFEGNGTSSGSEDADSTKNIGGFPQRQ